MPDVISFVFKPEEAIQWHAGQFLHYTLPHDNPDERSVERWFTISSAPFENEIHLTTRFDPKGSTFKKALHNLQIGETIEADGLEGDFVIDDPSKQFVFIAGGMGITPYRSILLDLDHKGISINAKLLYANRDENFVFKDQLESLKSKHTNFSIEYFISPQKIDEEAIKQAGEGMNDPIYYVSGPEPMVESFEKMMLAMGIVSDHFKRDFFPGYTWE